jgi:putative transposase
MRRFKSPGSAQRFLSCHAVVYNTFNVQRHLISSQTHQKLRFDAMTAWREALRQLDEWVGHQFFCAPNSAT